CRAAATRDERQAPSASTRNRPTQKVDKRPPQGHTALLPFPTLRHQFIRLLHKRLPLPLMIIPHTLARLRCRGRLALHQVRVCRKELEAVSAELVDRFESVRRHERLEFVAE